MAMRDLQPATVSDDARPSRGEIRPTAAWAGHAAPGSLPRPFTTFIGRRREVAAVRRLVARDRLVTLVGAGGIGKSRLAVEVANATSSTRHGPLYVQLAAAGATVPVDRTVAEALGIREEALSTLDALARLLDGGPRLLVLDECETVIEPLAHLLAPLLGACPGLHVLATSRRPIGLGGETVYRVPTLAVGPGDAGAGERGRQDAIALFVERVRAQRPDFEMTGGAIALAYEVCRRLDGMPLAIELAAARARHLGLGDLVARLDDQPRLLRGGPRDAPPRHHSIEATIDWSLGLLGPEARSLFQRLAVLHGRFDLPASAAIDGGGRGATESALSELVDQSLLVMEAEADGGTRYRMLEPIRQHALDLLRASAEEGVVLERHARHFAWVASRYDESVDTASEPAGLDRLRAQVDDVRAALEWALAHDPALAVEMTGDLSLFWLRDGHFVEGRGWLERALDLSLVAPRPARLLLGLSTMLEGLGEFGRALLIAREALDQTERGDDATRARILMSIGRLVAPDLPGAREAFEAGAAAARAAGDEGLRSEVLGEYANIEWALGRPELAIRLASAAVEVARRIKAPSVLAIPASVLARDAMWAARGDAEPLWDECLRAGRAAGDPLLAQFSLTFLALLAAWRGDLASAADRLAEAAGILRRAGGTPARLALAEMVGLVLIRAGRPFEGVRLFLAKERLGGPDWIDSSAWWAYASAEAERALDSLGPGADVARRTALAMSIEEVVAEAEREIERLVALIRPTRGGSSALSRREAEIAHLTSAGLTNREIGRRLFISERTAETHVQHILNKLGLANRAQIAAWAVENGVVARAFD